MDEKQLRILFSDIIKGYSLISSVKFGPFYLKHFNTFDVSEVDSEYHFHYSEAIKQSTPTVKDKEDYLISEKLWSKKDDEEIKKDKDFLQNLHINFEKEFLISRRELWKKQIKETEQRIKSAENKKSNLIGITAESYANKKSNEYYIKTSFFKDKIFDKPLFSTEEFEDLQETEINELTILYNKSVEKFNSANLKKLSISPFFLNLFYLCGDNLRDFYGKAAVELTFHQSELLAHGRQFKNILAEFPSIPQTIMNNPDELLDWVQVNRNYKEQYKGSGDTSGMTIPGASPEDYKALGMEAKANISFNQELKKKGKLNIEDLMRLHGE
jgi:hypothetical protein